MNKLRKYRRERGYTQIELARAVGVHQPAVSNWEWGVVKPAPKHISKLIELLGHSEEELFENEC